MLSKSIIDELCSIVGAQRCMIADEIGADFCHDELPNLSGTPDAVCSVDSTEAVSAIMALCNQNHVPVTVRGAGTGKAGGSVPVKDGVVLSLKDMNRIISVDTVTKTMVAQPGVLLGNIKAEAAKNNLYYPVDPGEKTATIGGNASTNAAGPCALKYGSTKDYILDAVIVLSDGSVTRLSDRPEYASVLGSEGTLSVITELSLKLIDKPACDVTLLLPFADTESCINAAITIKDSNEYAPAILEYLDTDLIEFSGNVTGNSVFPINLDGGKVAATLMLTLEAETDDQLDELLEAIAELSEELECLDVLVVDSPSLKREVFDAYDAFHTSMEVGARSSSEINIDVPATKMCELIEFAKEAGNEKGIKVMPHAHVGSGGLHIHVVSELAKDALYSVMNEFSDAVLKKCAEFGGCIVGEYGVGVSKRSLFKTLCPEEYAKASVIKAVLDPNGILNPEKLL